jgi:hypothetical protein
MGLTLKLVNLVDKLHLQKFFLEKDNQVLLNLSFDPKKFEAIIDKLIPVDGKFYQPNEFEKEVIKELDR